MKTHDELIEEAKRVLELIKISDEDVQKSLFQRLWVIAWVVENENLISDLRGD